MYHYKLIQASMNHMVFEKETSRHSKKRGFGIESIHFEAMSSPQVNSSYYGLCTTHPTSLDTSYMKDRQETEMMETLILRQVRFEHHQGHANT